MKRNIMTLLMGMIIYLYSFAYTPCTTCPTDNPMATFYVDSGDYAFWTDEINWSNVVDMSTYPTGADNFAKFKNACDELYAVGGGVLYYPAGTYNFDIPDGPADEGLMLKKGVVIRGAAPSTDIRANKSFDIKNLADTNSGLKSLSTKFVFTTKTIQGGPVNKMWNCIGAKKGSNETNLGQVSHVGIAHVEINHGYIYFGLDSKTWAVDYLTSKGYIGKANTIISWQTRKPDGTLPMDLFAGQGGTWGADTAILGEKRFVFGCRLINAGMCNYIVNKPNRSNFDADPYPFAWAGKIMAYGKHIFIANNVIAKPTASFRPFNFTCKKLNNVASTLTTDVRFDYGYGIGIDVNKSGASGFGNRCFINNAIPSIIYSEDVIIQDNFIYNHGNKGIEAAGKWLVIKNNVMPRSYFAHNDDPYGIGAVTYGANWSNAACWSQESSDDMMSRALDLGGWNAWATRNFYRSTGSSYANDGEGLLCQRHNGFEVYSWAYTQNVACDNCGGQYGYLAPYDVHCIGMFQGWNRQSGATGTTATRANWIEDIAAPEEINFKFDGITNVAPSGSSGIHVMDFITNCGSTVTATDKPINVSLVVDIPGRNVLISYKDNSSNEIAFRIDKRIHNSGKPFTVMAYRPRQQTTSTTPLNDTAIISKTFGYPAGAQNQACHPGYVTIDEMNPSQWCDYKYNMMYNYEYRVVAIDCNNTADGASNSVYTNFSEKYSDIIKTMSLKISPNPVKDNAIITFTLNEKANSATLDIIDINGKLVKSISSGNQTSVTISTQDLAKGTYLVKISDNLGNGIIDKMIVE